MSTVPRPNSRAGRLESHGHVAGSQRIGKPIIYLKNPAFIGCFGRFKKEKIVDVAKCLDSSAAATGRFWPAMRLLTNKYVREMHAKD
jgi:hypothetical protein